MVSALPAGPCLRCWASGAQHWMPKRVVTPRCERREEDRQGAVGKVLGEGSLLGAGATGWAGIHVGERWPSASGASRRKFWEEFQVGI